MHLPTLFDSRISLSATIACSYCDIFVYRILGLRRDGIGPWEGRNRCLQLHDDLIFHLFTFLTDNLDRRNATLVWKSWFENSHNFPARRSAYLAVLSGEGDRAEGYRHGAYISTLKDIFLHRPHIARFQIECEYHSPLWWRDLAIFMRHVRCLTIEALPTFSTEEQPFILNDLPSLTFLQITYEWWFSSITLRLPALETFKWTPRATKSDVLHELNLVCPNLKNLETLVWRETVVNPSIHSHLQSLSMTVLSVSGA